MISPFLEWFLRALPVNQGLESAHEQQDENQSFSARLRLRNWQNFRFQLYLTIFVD